MDRITQEAYYRQRVLKYAAKHGVTRAAERYRMSRKTVHKWKRRYDGTVESLKNRSRAPLHSPLKQSDWEIQLVQRYAKKYPRDLLLGYEKAQKSGYVRSYGCFKRTASKLRPPEKKKRARQNKPYERAAYPGQKLQVDVKFVPLRGQWPEILPIHGQGRMHALDIPGNVRGAQHAQRLAVSDEPGS